MTAVNAGGGRRAIGLVANTNGILNMSTINGAAPRPGVGFVAAAAEAAKTTVLNVTRREPGAGIVAITAGIVKAPFDFGTLQAGRPAALGRDYLVDGAVAFLATTLLGGIFGC